MSRVRLLVHMHILFRWSGAQMGAPCEFLLPLLPSPPAALVSVSSALRIANATR